MVDIIDMNPPFDKSMDMLLEIISHLDVASIVRLSMTSNSFRQLIYETRVIWIRALQQFEQSEFLAPHSLAPSDMELPELIRCATRPLRMKHQFQLGCSPTLPTHKFRLEYPIPKENRHYARHSRVLPGGRWLLTTGGLTDSTYLFCWDLKSVSGAETLPVLSPVAQIKASATRLKKRHYQVMDYVNIEFDPSHRRANILLFYEGNLNEMTYEMFHLSWSTEDAPPTFSRLSKMTIPHHSSLDSIRGPMVSLLNDTVCVGSSRGLTIWNWRTEAWGNVTMDKDLYDMAWWIQAPFIYAVSLLSPGSISLLRIPPLGPVSEPLVSHQGVPEALDFETPDDLVGFSYHRFSDWRPHTVQPRLRLFHLKHSLKQLLVSTESHSDAAEPPRVLQSSYSSPPRFMATPYLLSNNFIASISPWPAQDGVLRYRIQLFNPGEPLLEGPRETFVRFPLEGDGWYSGGLLPAPCAISGHFVVLEGNGYGHVHGPMEGDEDVLIYALGCFL